MKEHSYIAAAAAARSEERRVRSPMAPLKMWNKKGRSKRKEIRCDTPLEKWKKKYILWKPYCFLRQFVTATFYF
jgi:hypothetical protein